MTAYKLDALAISPHPDDAELAIGGTLAKLVKLGHTVGILDLTRGELSSAGDLESRSKETIEASKVLGLSFRENLDLPDGGLETGAQTQIVTLVNALRRIRPEVVLVPHIEDRHPDHVAAHHLLKRAIFLANVAKFPDKERPIETGGRFSPRQVLYYALRFHFTPSFIVDTSDFAAVKVNAINCYASQIRRAAGVNTLLNSPLNLSSLESRDRYFGSMIGVSHGEPFLTENALGIGDPVEHFRRNPYSEALLFPGRS